ncbi:MAG: F0F1 ATP synthase subunit A [Clostridiaceae bacterium]|nr:F0F1 ATP synthase subunit A [Clostridiaceae bacterium]
MLDIKNYWVIEIAGVEVWITESIFNTWIIMAILITIAIIARIKLRNFKEIPTGFQNLIEAGVELFDDIVTGAMGNKLSYVAPWFFMVFVFVFSSSLFSAFGLRAPTADFATTFALSMVTFLMMIFMGLRHRKGKFLKSLFEPNFVFFPINLIGELAKPVSLSFRLFGNVLSGTIILTLWYALTPRIFQIGIPAAFHAFFDAVIGFLQTYIFVIISLMYIKEAADG